MTDLNHEQRHQKNIAKIRSFFAGATMVVGALTPFMADFFDNKNEISAPEHDRRLHELREKKHIKSFGEFVHDKIFGDSIKF